MTAAAASRISPHATTTAYQAPLEAPLPHPPPAAAGAGLAAHSAPAAGAVPLAPGACVEATAAIVRHAGRLPLLVSTAVGTTAGLLAVLPYYGVRGAEDWWHGKPITSPVNHQHLALAISVPVAAWCLGVGIGLAMRYGNSSRRQALGQLRAMRQAAPEPKVGTPRPAAAATDEALRRSAWMPCDDLGLITLGTVGGVPVAAAVTTVAVLGALCCLALAGLSGHAPSHADCGGDCDCAGACDACSLMVVPNCYGGPTCWPLVGMVQGHRPERREGAQQA